MELTTGPQQYPECISPAKMSLHFSRVEIENVTGEVIQTSNKPPNYINIIYISRTLYVWLTGTGNRCAKSGKTEAHKFLCADKGLYQSRSNHPRLWAGRSVPSPGRERQLLFPPAASHTAYSVVRWQCGALSGLRTPPNPADEILCDVIPLLCVN